MMVHCSFVAVDSSYVRREKEKTKNYEGHWRDAFHIAKIPSQRLVVFPKSTEAVYFGTCLLNFSQEKMDPCNMTGMSEGPFGLSARDLCEKTAEGKRASVDSRISGVSIRLETISSLYHRFHYTG